MRSRVALASLLAAALAACDGGGAVLVVDLKTDYLPGTQFFGVRTELAHEELRAMTAREDTFARASDDFLTGQRVAELRGLSPGGASVRVTLLDATGEVVATRLTRVTLSGQRALTVLITSACEGVTCPAADGDPQLSACVGGRCVDPRCSPETPELCGTPGCASDADCASTLACTTGACIDRECFARTDDALCAPSELCHPLAGCVPRPGADASVEPDAGGDAGPPCPELEASCTDGLDDDCDGATDCADPDCASASCDDGNACTRNDVCDTGVCAGELLPCDDANPCTDDTCDPLTGCSATNNTASCDDGFFCNGADRCAGGVCVSEGVSPCPSFCNEVRRACEECMVDADCGAVSYGSYGTCGGFSGTCGESGTQSRSVMTPRCGAGACTVATTSESRACSRDTDGTSCGTTTYTAWGACGGFANACDTTGTQSRTRTDPTCTAGACAGRNTTETRACSRTVADGTSCGGTWQRCCGGVCRDLTTNGFCGACGVSCTAIGRTCASTGTGGYACRGCTSNAECVGILNSAATCYDVAAPPAFCNCQCPSNGVCANAGCGAGMYCHDCPGQNFCAPFGGSC